MTGFIGGIIHLGSQLGRTISGRRGPNNSVPSSLQTLPFSFSTEPLLRREGRSLRRKLRRRDSSHAACGTGVLYDRREWFSHSEMKRSPLVVASRIGHVYGGSQWVRRRFTGLSLSVGSWRGHASGLLPNTSPEGCHASEKCWNYG